MNRRSPTDDAIRQRLDALYAATEARARIPHDPVRAIHRYTRPDDQEVAGFLAAGFAFGRVDLFLPVLDRMLDVLNRRGGPAAAARAWSPSRDPDLDGIAYRWIREGDVGVVLGAIGHVLGTHARLGDALGAEGPWRERLSVLVDALRHAALDAGRQRGMPAERVEDLPRGVRTFMPSPRDGSACKRLNLWARWMVRPGREGVDVGLWTHVSPADLVMPVDVHVGRVARFLGLTDRAANDWRTAEAITAALRAWDPEDPVRYDFALAHLGISKACRGGRDDEVCPDCPLDAVCRAARVA